ncbi:hypothetical protein DPMN_109475 [Dreissena polymorpha]|uniref:Uncharacterized protein n=1 Tax=Dreissena polymorpha TaxID=45954 RepID=A0A9D4KAC3_DREPO|nr:hypothetical protein DPMN_109475 [Dreissena polymorpha]
MIVVNPVVTPVVVIRIFSKKPPTHVNFVKKRSSDRYRDPQVLHKNIPGDNTSSNKYHATAKMHAAILKHV